MKKGTQRALSREKICEAALAVVNTEGLEGLTMRHLARELGVEAASLYNHITDKSDLFDLIQEALFNSLKTPIKEKDWKKYMRALAHSMRSGLLQYPKVIPLFATRPSVAPAALERAEKTLSVLCAAGFTSLEALFAYQSLAIFVLGHLQAEAGTHSGIDSTDAAFDSLEEKKFPNLFKVYSQMENLSYTDWFEFGLNIIITGLENTLAAKGKKI